MGFNIEDSTGKGYGLKVDSENRLWALTKSESLQHIASKEDGKAFQVIGDTAAINNNTVNVLHITNDSTTEYMIVTYIRLQTIDLAGGTAPPDSGAYWQVGKDMSYSSTGATVTPVNMNFTSGNTATVTAYDDNPTLTGTFVEFDRYYPATEDDKVTYDKEGTIILGKGDSLTIRFTATSTSGEAYARVSFLMEKISD